MKTEATVSVPPGGKDDTEVLSEQLEKYDALKNAPQPKKTGKNKEITVFLVDDDLLFLKALEHSITSKLPSATIKSFQTGEACLQQIKLKPEVVILDYYLNSTVPYAWNGLTILKQLKKISPKTKVIMLSAQDSLDVAVKCIDNGSFDYISKTESAFVKINNVLSNIIDDYNTNNKGIKPYQVISMVIIIILMICFLLK
ncbi:MAG: response regulator [Bacteroidia bacterium]|jgi:DNA-binding NtrC family response regulator